jgi:hypothetical protein
MSLKKFSFIAVILALASSMVAAQINYPVNPNPSGLQTTPYSTSTFSATFNGPVKVLDSYRSEDNQSSNTVYSSVNENAAQIIIVRFIDHDIAVNQESADFYADDDRVGGTITNRSTGSWEGHIYTYTMHHYVKDGYALTQRCRYIIVNSREVIFIEQISSEDYNDQNEWLDFEYSLRIK